MNNKSFINDLVDHVVSLTGVFSAAALTLFLVPSIFAGMREEPRSFSLNDKSQDQVDRKILPKIDGDSLLAEDLARGKEPGPLRFAVAVDVDLTLNNSGTWQILPDGRLWRLRIRSPEAKSINLGITRFDMPGKAKLWIYDPGHRYVEGPYTARDRSHHGSLWTPIIQGEEIVIEVFVPEGVEEPQIQIGKANQAYRDFLNVRGNEVSGSCNNDVVCPEGNPWDDQIRSVARYSISGTGLCSGQLMNNTSLDWTPYFLSANHCGVNTGNDQTLVFYWNFESPVCGLHGGGSLGDNQSGAIFRASYSPSDFLLVELEEFPSPASNVFFSGWDATGAAAASTVGIHHPSGDEKSISFNTTAVTGTDYLGYAVSSAKNHWRVDDWEDGTTEGGSSGSCLWDAATKRCVGQLHGGYALCSAPFDSDWYGKLSVSWNGGGSSATRLRDWLDPPNSGVLSMDGDPHLTTADGIHYDFQGGGEYVSLREPDGLEIQTRLTPVATTFNPGANPYTGLATCVSLNTAVAARVGPHRVTIQPNINGIPDPAGLQVRIDGNLTAVGPGGVDLGPGAGIFKDGNNYQVIFPDGTLMVVASNYWTSQGKWYLNVDVVRNPASGLNGGEPGGDVFSEGLIAALAPNSWLPALPHGTPTGLIPNTLHKRYSVLYQKFGDSWRVNDATSLFDYAPGTSTETFTDRDWPREGPPCTISSQPTAGTLDENTANQLCLNVTDEKMNDNCVFDVTRTGEPGFANLYLTKQLLRDGFTLVDISLDKDPVRPGERMTLTATVSRRNSTRGIPAGTIQFMLDGVSLGDPVPLDARGRVTRTLTNFNMGVHHLMAYYRPQGGGVFLASNRLKSFTVMENMSR